MPPHDHPPHHHPHHHKHHRRALRISEGGFDHAVEILAVYVGQRHAGLLVEQGSDGPPEPVSQFYTAITQTAVLTELVRAAGAEDLKVFADGLIDLDRRAGELSIEEGAMDDLKRTFGKDDANRIERAAADGPGEMRAVAIVNALNLRLIRALANPTQHQEAA